MRHIFRIIAYMMMPDTNHIVALADAYCAATGRSAARVATLVHNQGRFIDNLRAGKGCSVATYNKVLQWFDDHWPSSVAWPEGVPRPAQQKHDTNSDGRAFDREARP